MRTAAKQLRADFYTRAANDDCIKGGSGTRTKYIYAGSEPVAVYSRTTTLVNAWNYLLSNHQGSIAAITNSSGAIAVNEDFTAFGARRNPTTWSGAPTTGDLTAIAGLSRQGYTFQTALGQSMGLNHMNGRVEDAITGRFLSPDRYIPDPSSTQSYNRFSYVRNNPLSSVDPTGFLDQPLPDLISDNGGGDAEDGDNGGGDITVGVPYTCNIDDCQLPGLTVTPTPDSPASAGDSSGGSSPFVSGRFSGGSSGGGGGGDSGGGGDPLHIHVYQASGNNNSAPHRYVVTTPTTCTTGDSMDALKARNFSAPGAPAAVEGFTSPIPLWHITSPNLISQSVDTPNGTIVNTALAGHEFQGTVTTQVTPMGTGSLITTVGAGTPGESWWKGALDDVAGGLLFGLRNYLIQTGCDAANGIPNNL